MSEESVESVASRYVQAMADPTKPKVFITTQVLMAQLINRVGMERADELIEEAKKTWQLMTPEGTKVHTRFRP